STSHPEPTFQGTFEEEFMRFVQRLAMFVCAIAVALPAILAAQSDSGRVSGSVRDATNAFVQGATITAKNEKTGETRTVLSDKEGRFLITPLKPSNYTITVSYEKFAPIVYTEIPVAVGQELALDFEVKPAALQETVNVVGTAPIIDLSSSKIGVN